MYRVFPSLIILLVKYILVLYVNESNKLSCFSNIFSLIIIVICLCSFLNCWKSYFPFCFHFLIKVPRNIFFNCGSNSKFSVLCVVYFCRRRTLVAIGTHDLDTLVGPFSYEASAIELYIYVYMFYMGLYYFNTTGT